MNRIYIEFNKLKCENKKALVPFVTFGNLTSEELANVILDMRKEGANIVEIGVPFSEALADGKVIQDAYTVSREFTKIPLLLGFGISSKESVSKIKEYSDGVIVGSAVVKRINDNTFIEFIREIREELDK